MCAFCALTALLIAALMAPAPAVAQAPATQEYDLNLPQAEGDDKGGRGSDEDEAAAIAPPASAPPTAPGPEAAAPVTPEAIDENSGRPKEEKGAGGDGSPGASGSDRAQQNLAGSGSGDGGFPALLLLLGAIAGISVGFAFWRLRRDDGPRGSTPADVTSGTR